MKLLLTSAGLTNASIVRSLEDLTGKPARGTRLLHIPTATMVDAGDKHALIDELDHLRELGYEVDMLDVAAVPASVWEPRFQAAEVIYVSGGNVYWLNAQLQKSGVADKLPELLQSRVYVGASAGSTVTCRRFSSSLAPYFGEEDDAKLAAATTHGLELVDFLMRGHYNNPHRPERNDAWYENIAAHVTVPVYALDDQSAIMVNGSQIEVVSEGNWRVLNTPAAR